MERSRDSNTVVFDLGEVLATPIDLYAQLADVLGSDAGTVESAYWLGRDAHDRGSTIEDYWGVVAHEAGIQEADEVLTRRLSEVDSTAWATIRDDAAAVLRELSDAGARVAILSNAPVALGEVARAADWATYVDEWFFSGDLGIAKPDPDIYALVTQRLEVPAAEIVFFDDRQINVEGARNAGWNAHLWTSGEQTRETLVELGIL